MSEKWNNVTPLQIYYLPNLNAFLHLQHLQLFFPTWTSANVTSCVHTCSPALTPPHCHRRTSGLLIRFCHPLLEIHGLLPNLNENPSPSPDLHLQHTQVLPASLIPSTYFLSSPQGLCTFSSLYLEHPYCYSARGRLLLMIQRSLPRTPHLKKPLLTSLNHVLLHFVGFIILFTYGFTWVLPSTLECDILEKMKTCLVYAISPAAGRAPER